MNFQGFKTILTMIAATFLYLTAFCVAEGDFRLVLFDGTVVEGEMIRVTPSTIEIDPEGPKSLMVVNRDQIADIIYTKLKPGKIDNIPAGIQPSRTGILAVKYNSKNIETGNKDWRLVFDYIMIDSLLYDAGRFADFMIELSSGWRHIEFCGIKAACYEKGDFYYIENGGSGTAIWKQSGNGFHSSNGMTVDIHPDSITLISFNRVSGDYIIIDDDKSGVLNKSEFTPDRRVEFREICHDDGIIPGGLILGEVPSSYQYHDSLEYRYDVVYDEIKSARFNNRLFLPGVYSIATRVTAYNKWRYAETGEKTNRYDIEIRGGYATTVEFQSFKDRLDCRISISPEKRFEISASEAK